MLVLAGGFGTRLQSVVSDTPKALAPINGIPLLKLQLSHWISQGQKEFTFLLCYQSSKVIKYLESLTPDFLMDSEINYLVEDKPLGTGGAISNAISLLEIKGDLLITNADTWLGGGLREISRTNQNTIGVISAQDTGRYGRVSFNEERLITSFEEKLIYQNKLQSGYINAGLYKISSETFLTKKGPYSLDKDLLPDLVKQKNLRAFELNVDFFDIGVPSDYIDFSTWFLNRG